MAANSGTTTLFRPVGQMELDLIEHSGWKAFPPRLKWQPIFYPVLNEEYATFIAREWNTRDLCGDYVGYVLRFQVMSDYLVRYQVQQVGSLTAKEYWIPAEDLEAFNGNIVGLIEVVSRFGEMDIAQRARPPLISEAEMLDLAAAFSKHQHLSKSGKRGSPYSWSNAFLEDLLYENYPEEVWRAILTIQSIDQSILMQQNLSAGLIEDLLGKYGDRFIARIERQARLDPAFAKTLGGVWQGDMSDENWRRLQAVWNRRGWDGIPE